MEWSKKRKITYTAIFFAIILLLIAYPLYLALHPTPTCFNQRQDGDETGIDCGGSCSLACLADIKPLSIFWAKAFPLSRTSYDLGAYIGNPNTKYGVKNARYTFRVIDNIGRTLIEKSGSTEIAPGTEFVPFDPHVAIQGVPDRVEITFNQDDLSRWFKAKVAQSIVTIKNQNLINTNSAPRFDATLVNTDLVNDVGNLTASAIIYDALHSPVALSQTAVSGIPMGGSQNIFYTWPNRFSKHTGGGICTTPVDTMLVIDRSGSMDVGRKNPPEPLTSAKNAAETYIDSAEQVDKVGFLSFATTATNPIDHVLSLDHEAVKGSIEAISVDKSTLQYTDLGDALAAALAELKSDRHLASAKPVIIALTDGVANRPIDRTNPKDTTYPEDFAAQVATAARTAGIDIYTIGLGADINESALRDRIATDPTHYFRAPAAGGLEGIYRNISQTVCKEEGFITDIVVTPKAIFAQ